MDTELDKFQGLECPSVLVGVFFRILYDISCIGDTKFFIYLSNSRTLGIKYTSPQYTRLPYSTINYSPLRVRIEKFQLKGLRQIMNMQPTFVNNSPMYPKTEKVYEECNKEFGIFPGDHPRTHNSTKHANTRDSVSYISGVYGR